jgi:glycosidase
MRGMPQIYYGDEIGMPGGNDPDNRQDFPGGFPGDAWPADQRLIRRADSIPADGFHGFNSSDVPGREASRRLAQSHREAIFEATGSPTGKRITRQHNSRELFSFHR